MSAVPDNCVCFTGGCENVDPNIQTTSRIPGPSKQQPVSLFRPSSSNTPSLHQAAFHVNPTPLHPLTSAADAARPSRIPSPVDRAVVSASGAAHLPSLPVIADALPAQVDTLALSAPDATAKPASPLHRPPVPFGPAPSASGTMANPEESVRTAQAAACTGTAPLYTHSSEQAKATSSIPAVHAAQPTAKPQSMQPMTISQSTQPAATFGEAAPASRRRSSPLSSLPAPVQATAKDPIDSSAQLAMHPVATRTRAASRQHTLASLPLVSSKPPSSPMPGPSCHDHAFPLDSDSAAADAIDSSSDSAALLSQRPSELRAGNPSSLPVMLANPLFMRPCSRTRPTTGKLPHIMLCLG